MSNGKILWCFFKSQRNGQILILFRYFYDQSYMDGRRTNTIFEDPEASLSALLLLSDCPLPTDFYQNGLIDSSYIPYDLINFTFHIGCVPSSQSVRLINSNDGTMMNIVSQSQSSFAVNHSSSTVSDLFSQTNYEYEDTDSSIRNGT